ARERVPTAELGARQRAEGFPVSNFGDGRYVTWGGGVPLVLDGEVVGAIGVSGLPEHEDVALATMAASLLHV
ncbi:MAG: heme-binding protein, partial [Actinobacteria bacterium]